MDAELGDPSFGLYSPGERRIEREFRLPDWSGKGYRESVDYQCSAVVHWEEELLILPRRAALYGVSLRDGSVNLLHREDGRDDCWISGTGTISPDRRYCAFPLFHPPHATPSRVEMLIFSLPDFRLVRRHDFGGFLANHFQFTYDPEYIMYAHEGPTRRIPDRINRIHWLSGRCECLHEHLFDLESGEMLECIGHEMAAPGADMICAVRYPDSRIRAAILLLDCDGRNCRELDCDDYWHVSCDPSGTVFAADTMWWSHARRREENRTDIIRIDAAAGTKEIVKTIRTFEKGQHRHPHPQLDSTGNRLLFMENSPESDEFASVTLLEPDGKVQMQ
ncbi:hypothetical protein SDC9_135717 [bioreactor metagenome]|uniref:Oligogalacturonate lyase domain-containing protein n=1 Tax=bioreactor metagenome TaxID=1076179 RepID=A0A645DIH9_9ZZZZ